MDDRHEQIIGTHRAELTRKLTIKNNLLWEELIELKVITGGEVQCIKVKILIFLHKIILILHQ